MTIPAVPNLAPRLLDRLHAAGDERLRPIGLERVLVGRGALEVLPAEVERVRQPGRVVLLEDATPMRFNGDDLKQTVATLLSPLGDVDRVVLGPGDGRLHADAPTLAAARDAVAGAGCVVTVGSGTLTDVGKDAVHAHPGLPLVAVQTATSVNGYADDMAVILRDGVKRTVPSVWPLVLIVDTQVIADAPPALTRSGFGEMLAMFTAPADWRLASFVGLDPSFSLAVIDLFRPRGDELLNAAGAVAEGDRGALNLLAELLTSSGVAMGAAGRTAPLSGTEHLISHLLDMSAATEGREVGLHGAQVGVAAVVAGCIWERALERLDPGVLASSDAFPSVEAIQPRVKEAFRRLDPSGVMGAECWSGYRKKLTAWHERRSHLASLDWTQVLSELRRLVGNPAEMAAALAKSGAPTRFSRLTPPIDPATARWAVTSCHLMRDRFTVVDLAFLTGSWTDEDVEAVLERAADLGGGL